MLRLDQETVDSLPRLADVYDAYGVEVNALSVEEIFALYERTGFLYPDKAARLFPHLSQVRENWRRMLSGGADSQRVRSIGSELVSAGEPVSSTCIRLNGTDHRRTSIVGPETCVFCVAEDAFAASAKANSHCALQRFSSRGFVRDRFSGARKHLHNRGRIRTRC